MTDLAPNPRSCYCKAGETFCGTCERCGAPGHTRHFPGPVPVTGAWCDRCYRVVQLRHRALRIGVPIIAVAAVVAVSRSCAG